MEKFERLIRIVVGNLRQSTEAQTVNLVTIHGSCVHAAKSDAPRLVNFLDSVDGRMARFAALADAVCH